MGRHAQFGVLTSEATDLTEMALETESRFGDGDVSADDIQCVFVFCATVKNTATALEYERQRLIAVTTELVFGGDSETASTGPTAEAA